ncbi:uncharacterized protein LOC127837041 isoform X1 [Dreissena polymorpha]|nr:uncharacterized protein LOC127837041 isoform X1 [Dreissena polymorpha]XP_052219757.1 uncharacterized protein LOC127837041 isoform X1 [Dreissena polymorpha]
MSALVGANEAQRLPRKHGKGRFASRKVPKSKSLQTLETNLDDVFADELGQPGELQKTPSVHELRVSNSLSKLNVPDWFKKSSFSRSGSTQSLFTYAGRVGSTSTLGSTAYYPSMPSSPSPSVTPGSNAVIIQKRVTPNKTTPTSTRLLRAPMLPVTPERSPIHNTPPAVSLPSEKFRKTDSRKELKPITIVPFAKLREMFERKSQEDPNSPTVSTPTKEKPKVRFEEMCVTHETVVRSENQKPVQIERTMSPPPPIPERKPIVSDNHGYGDAANRKTQVHFSDESYVSKTQEQVNFRELNKANDRSQEHTNELNRQNGTTPSTNNKSSTSTGKKSGFRAALPQFRFRRPGSYVTKMTSSETESAQSKKGKDIDCLDGYYGEYTINKDTFDNTPPPTWLHALEYKAKIDGETLFEFLQKRRYSSILENGFAEQLDELQEKDAIFRFPVMTVNHHSINGSGPNMADSAGDLRVILTNVYNNRVQNGYLHSRLRGGAPIDDVLDGLLLLDGYSTGRMKVNENGRIVPRSAETPDTPPGFVFPYPVSAQIGKDGTLSENGDGEAIQSEYVLIRCEAPHCQRETNLKEARKYFKSCHSCFTYYCSRTCRKADWFAHKRMCVFSKLNSACKHVIKHINKQPHLQYQCSRIARRGYLSQGRGCVVFAFPDISSADEFLNFGMERLCVPPIYVPLKELPNAEMLGSKLEILSDTCKQYNPELKYVIHVAIVIPFQLPSRPVPRRMESIIQKCAKLRLSPAHMHPKQEHSDIPSTLILTAVPGNQHADDFDGRKTRELCFINIQRKLRNRGVSLRHKFPVVYNKLIDFVSDAKHFSPLIIYPMDSRTGRKFMCVIMPEAEPEIEWIRDPDLFHELGVFDDDEANGSTSNLSNHLQPEVML